MGYSMDVKLLSFAHHPKSILTLYPPPPSPLNEKSGFKAPETRLHTLLQEVHKKNAVPKLFPCMMEHLSYEQN